MAKRSGRGRTAGKKQLLQLGLRKERDEAGNLCWNFQGKQIGTFREVVMTYRLMLLKLSLDKENNLTNPA